MGDHVNDTKIYVNKKGKIVPRVSEILKLLAKDQLILWANYLGFKRIDYKSELDRTARIGTMAHDVIDSLTAGNPVLLDYAKYKLYAPKDIMEAKNCVKSFLKWYEKNKDWYKVILSDETFVSESFGGTLDCVIQSIYTKDKNHVIISDYKTSKQFTLSHFIQLVGYLMILEDTTDYKVDGVMIVRMNKADGKIAQHRLYRRDELQPYLDIFTSLVKIHASLNELKSMGHNYQ